MLPKLKPQFSTVDEYIALQKDLQVRETLEQLRKTIIAAAPNADEIISYQMPAYRFHGILVWFAVAKNHYGFYPAANAIKVFKAKLKGYECSKGTVRFPMDKPLPMDLITEIVKYRVEENQEKAMLKELGKNKKNK